MKTFETPEKFFDSVDPEMGLTLDEVSLLQAFESIVMREEVRHMYIPPGYTERKIHHYRMQHRKRKLSIQVIRTILSHFGYELVEQEKWKLTKEAKETHEKIIALRKGDFTSITTK